MMNLGAPAIRAVQVVMKMTEADRDSWADHPNPPSPVLQQRTFAAGSTPDSGAIASMLQGCRAGLKPDLRHRVLHVLKAHNGDKIDASLPRQVAQAIKGAELIPSAEPVTNGITRLELEAHFKSPSNSPAVAPPPAAVPRSVQLARAAGLHRGHLAEARAAGQRAAGIPPGPYLQGGDTAEQRELMQQATAAAAEDIAVEVGALQQAAKRAKASAERTMPTAAAGGLLPSTAVPTPTQWHREVSRVVWGLWPRSDKTFFNHREVRGSKSAAAVGLRSAATFHSWPGAVANSFLCLVLSCLACS
jgi:hypothetical protein